METTPSLKDLYKDITPRYAANWKVLGTLLGLPSGELNAIEAGYPTNVKWCCNQMLGKWLEMHPTASWNEILTAVESPALEESPVHNAYVINALDKSKEPAIYSYYIYSCIYIYPTYSHI